LGGGGIQALSAQRGSTAYALGQSIQKVVPKEMIYADSIAACGFELGLSVGQDF